MVGYYRPQVEESSEINKEALGATQAYGVRIWTGISTSVHKPVNIVATKGWDVGKITSGRGPEVITIGYMSAVVINLYDSNRPTHICEGTFKCKMSSTYITCGNCGFQYREENNHLTVWLKYVKCSRWCHDSCFITLKQLFLCAKCK